MRIQVIIPHLNQEEALRACLASLHAQDEVSELDVAFIVVDNGSQSLPEAVCASWEDVTLTSEAEPGPGPARNRGVAMADGDVLAFIDADCIAAPSWIAALTKALSRQHAPIIGGDVRVGYVDPSAPTALEAYENIYAYRNRRYIECDGYSGTGNLATFPQVMADVGPFAGIRVPEDWEWGQRAGAKGYRIVYVPDMIIYHPARKTFEELTRKWDRHIAHAYVQHPPTGLGTLRWLARAAALAVSPLAELPRVATSPRISGLRTRGLALLCLTRIRFYRARRMLQMLLQGNAKAISTKWNRE